MSRVRDLRRIAVLYGVVEEMHSNALRQASAEVQEADTAIGVQRHAMAAAMTAGRAALGQGDREEWLLAHADGEVATVRAGLLEGLKVQRVAVEASARDEFFKSRVKTEQMKQVVARLFEQAALEEGRRTQAASDDRYSARRAWQAGRRSNPTY